tara:strand:- start:631 stop:891 length:261 start_codon:yes stop_codon:yes gene_type:complete
MQILGFISLGIILVGMLIKHQTRKEETLVEFMTKEELGLWELVKQDHPSLTNYQQEQIFLDCLYNSTDTVDRDVQAMISSMYQSDD